MIRENSPGKRRHTDSWLVYSQVSYQNWKFGNFLLSVASDSDLGKPRAYQSVFDNYNLREKEQLLMLLTALKFHFPIQLEAEFNIQIS